MLLRRTPSVFSMTVVGTVLALGGCGDDTDGSESDPGVATQAADDTATAADTEHGTETGREDHGAETADDDASGDGPPPGDSSGGGSGAGDSYEPGSCLAEHFVQPPPHPANGQYPDPEVSASCTDTELIVDSNGIPGYEFQATTPNDLAAQDHHFVFPRMPTRGGQDEIPLLGTVAVAVNGLPIFGPNERAFPDPYGDPIYNGIMDFCLGHTGMGGAYHFHGLLVECLVGEVPEGEPSPIVGVSLDGYPIFGPVGCMDEDCTEVVRFESGWVQTGDPTTEAWDNHEYQPSDEPHVLDRCNGRIGPDGNYRYHATDTFPYVLGCYHGTP